MKLEVGKSYVNRRGDLVAITKHNKCDEYPFTDGNESYGEYGQYILAVQDLIAEAPEAAETCQIMPATERDTQPDDGGPACNKSMREWYAGMALGALVRERDALRVLNGEPDFPLERNISEACFGIADEMIKASRK